MSKWKVILLSILGLLIIAQGTAIAYEWHHIDTLNDQIKDAKNIIDAKNAGIQDINNKLGIAQSQLVEQSELNKKYKNELASLDTDFKKLVNKHHLELEARDHTIAQLKGQVKGGTTTVVVHEAGVPIAPPNTEVISYTWDDKYHRFHLEDPNIFVQNNEEFNYTQKVSLTGYVYTDTTGTLKLRKVNLQEVVQDGDKLIPVENSNIEIVDNKFEYIDTKQHQKSFWDIWHPRMLASFDSQLYPGLGAELLNLGRYWDYANLGLYTRVGVNAGSGLIGLKQSTINIGLDYQLVPPFFTTNLAVGASIGTPMDNFLTKYIFTVDAIFYLTN